MRKQATAILAVMACGHVILDAYSDPARLPGTGGLTITVEAATVAPAELVISGPEHRRVSVQTAHVSVTNLTAGRYLIQRLYPGGVRTEAVPVVVPDQGATDVVLKPEAVGGLRLRLDRAYCQSAQLLLSVQRVREDASKDDPLANAESVACRVEVGGLTPGDHAFSLPRRNGPELLVPRRRFTVQPQRWEEVQLPAPVVVLRGMVSNQNGSLGKRQLRLASRSTAERATATTDENGWFAVPLAAPGVYSVAIAGYGRHEALHVTPPLAKGENRFDILLNLGSIRLRLAPRALPSIGVTNLYLESAGGDVEVYDITNVDEDFEIEGVDLGHYSLWASGRDDSTEFKTVSLTESHPGVHVYLQFVKQKRTLVVPAGVTDLYLQLGSQRKRLPRDAGGAYSLASVAPGRIETSRRRADRPSRLH